MTLAPEGLSSRKRLVASFLVIFKNEGPRRDVLLAVLDTSDRWRRAFCDQLSGSYSLSVDHIQSGTDNNGNAHKAQGVREIVENPVSYTHLTLPTIYSV